MTNFKTKILILAGGQGKRMGGQHPKVLTNLKGKPIIEHLLFNLKSFEKKTKIGIVVGFGKELIMDKLGDAYDYYVQESLLGTGHAVKITEEFLKKEEIEQLVVLYGDHPFIQYQTVQKLLELGQKNSSPLSMLTVKVPDFLKWRQIFVSWGRILRDKNNLIKAVREYKDCTEEEKKIIELNPAMYAFRTEWLWKNINQIKNANAQGEYYLTDLVEIAIDEGHQVPTFFVDLKECMGINSVDELKIAQKILK